MDGYLELLKILVEIVTYLAGMGLVFLGGLLIAGVKPSDFEGM